MQDRRISQANWPQLTETTVDNFQKQNYFEWQKLLSAAIYQITQNLVASYDSDRLLYHIAMWVRNSGRALKAISCPCGLSGALSGGRPGWEGPRWLPSVSSALVGKAGKLGSSETMSQIPPPTDSLVRWNSYKITCKSLCIKIIRNILLYASLIRHPLKNSVSFQSCKRGRNYAIKYIKYFQLLETQL